jgi:RNA polymerase sigma-70 factor (sigma-E family)
VERTLDPSSPEDAEEVGMRQAQDRDDDAFVEFVNGSSPRLLTTAWMLTGDLHRAQDLVQESLERVYVRWGKVRGGNPHAYTRRILVNLHTDKWRQGRREVLTDAVPDTTTTTGRGSDRVDLVRALQQLPRRERQCVVLRHYLDLSEQQTADTLGVSVGTVKSSTSRGLTGLRDLLTEEESHV